MKSHTVKYSSNFRLSSIFHLLGKYNFLRYNSYYSQFFTTYLRYTKDRIISGIFFYPTEYNFVEYFLSFLNHFIKPQLTNHTPSKRKRILFHSEVGPKDYWITHTPDTETHEQRVPSNTRTRSELPADDAPAAEGIPARRRYQQGEWRELEFHRQTNRWKWTPRENFSSVVRGCMSCGIIFGKEWKLFHSRLLLRDIEIYTIKCKKIVECVKCTVMYSE